MHRPHGESDGPLIVAKVTPWHWLALWAGCVALYALSGSGWWLLSASAWAFSFGVDGEKKWGHR